MRNLLGDNPDPQLAASLSNETQVTPQTPPTFLFHTNSDSGVPAENSVLFYLALSKAGVPAEIHIYERGEHGEPPRRFCKCRAGRDRPLRTTIGTHHLRAAASMLWVGSAPCQVTSAVGP